MDTFRILAYGGISYSERVRVGRWPAIEYGAMGDRYAAREQPLSFGVGVVGGPPFVILRQIQDPGRRGGYPYTLLLDPGREAWEKVHWNGALLVKELLADPEMADILLRRVEAWSERIMREFVRRLAPLDDGWNATCGASILNYLWLGVQLREDPLIVGSEDGVFDRAAGPEWLASHLAGLPACFRLGCGWLLGGGLVQAKAFGTRLVYDPETGKSTPSVPPAIRNGLDLWAAWIELQHSDCGPALEVLSATPACDWPFPPSSILEAVRSGQKVMLHQVARQLAQTGGGHNRGALVGPGTLRPIAFEGNCRSATSSYDGKP